MRSGVPGFPGQRCSAATGPQFNASDLNGFWLVRPDGSRSPSFAYIAGVVNGCVGGLRVGASAPLRHSPTLADPSTLQDYPRAVAATASKCPVRISAKHGRTGEADGGACAVWQGERSGAQEHTAARTPCPARPLSRVLQNPVDGWVVPAATQGACCSACRSDVRCTAAVFAGGACYAKVGGTSVPKPGSVACFPVPAE